MSQVEEGASRRDGDCEEGGSVEVDYTWRVGECVGEGRHEKS